MKEFDGKYALITGAAGGIGSALARQLANLGCHLILVDIQKEGLEKLKVQLEAKSESKNIRTIVIDLSKQEEIEQLITTVDRIDILINNAGIAFGKSFTAINSNDINRLLAINLQATLQLTHGLLPLLQQNKGAHIVSIASGAGLLGPGGMVAYATSKHGLVGFSEALRVELKSKNIGVSVICPAFVKTNLITNSTSENNKKLDEMIQKEGITPNKVARVVIKSIRKNKGRVVIGSLTKGALITRFFFPRLAERLNYMNYKKLKKEDIIR